MDDPWGSPWADEIHHVVQPKPRDSDGVRPVSPAVAASALVEKIGTNSLWGDDGNDNEGNFGDWAAVSGEETTVKSGLVDNGWGITESLGDSASPDGLNGLRMPWNDTTTTPIPDPLSTLSPPAEIVRRISPDPWANRPVSNDPTPKEEHGAKLEDMGRKYISPVRIEESAEDYTSDSVSLDLMAGENLHSTVKGNGTHEETVEADVLPDNIRMDELESNETSTEIPDGQSTTQEAGHESSRPSSPSEHSRHDANSSDSPRTSLDEEPKKPMVERKPSSKVQELVQHFDSISEQHAISGVNLVNAELSRQKSEKGIVESEEEADDFGDFEESHSVADEEITEVAEQQSCGTAIAEESVDATTIRQDLELVEVQDHKPSEKNPHGQGKVYGPVEFNIDTSIMDGLFSDTATKTPSNTTEKLFIPDTIIHDSFSSTEQRKTWYRISRYGTMRKYNTGDDENYKMVDWAQSQIRVETIKIVARWMEEDRISGRVVLGGSSKTSSMFGWDDPNPAPMPISQALAAKHGKRKDRVDIESNVEIPREWPQDLATSRHASPKRRSSGKSTSMPTNMKPNPLAPAPNFGWSTAPNGQQESKSKTVVHNTENSGPLPQPVSTITSIPLHQTSLPQGSTSSMQTMVTKTSPKPTEAAKEANLPSISPKGTQQITPKNVPISILAPVSAPQIPSNDDDDWGEMVSSPILAPAPSLPLSLGLHHKKSTSIAGAFPTGIPNISRVAQVIPPPSGLGHRSTSSFDILIPKSRGPGEPIETIPVVSKSPVGTLFESSYSPNSTSHIPTATPTTSNMDPWASVDFSYFDMAPSVTAKPVPAPLAAAQPTPAKDVSFAKPMKVTSTSAQSSQKLREGPSALAQRNQKSSQEQEQERIVKSITDGLPDLSYMFRR